MTTYDNFDGKVVYISGAAQGIGRATALAFAERGARLALSDLDAAGLTETVGLVRKRGAEALELAFDVADWQQTTAAFGQLATHFERLDIAVNNAGQEQRDSELAEVDVDYYDRIMGTNVRGMFLAMKAQVPLLRSAGGGAIINISSGAGVMGIKGQGVYAASKHAVIGLSRSAALDYATEGIRVNVVAPGVIETPMMRRVFGEGEAGRENASAQEPIGRPGAPEEIAAAVLWLASDAAPFTIGHTLVVDGGQTIQ